MKTEVRTLSGTVAAGFFAYAARLATFSSPVKPIIAIGSENASEFHVGSDAEVDVARERRPVEQERQPEHRQAHLHDQVEGETTTPAV